IVFHLNEQIHDLLLMFEPLFALQALAEEVEIGKETNRSSLGNRPDSNLSVAEDRRQKALAWSKQRFQQIGQEAGGHDEVTAPGRSIDSSRHLVSEQGVFLARLRPEHLVHRLFKCAHPVRNAGKGIEFSNAVVKQIRGG